MKNIPYNTIDIKKFLPHREPMLLVDELKNITETSVETTFKVSNSCIFVSNNTLNEVALIENAAQTCSAIVGRKYFDDSDEENDSKVVGFISAIKSFNTYKLPIVDTIITTKSNLITKFDAGSYSICTMKGEIFIDSEVIANFTMNLFIQEV